MQKQLRYFLTLLLLAFTSVGWADSWVKTAASSLQTGDIVVIVDETSSTAMSNNNGTSKAPTAVAFDVSNIADTLKWEVTVDGSNYQFKAFGTETYLYCTNTNNGVRVGTNTNNVFTIFNNEGIDFLFNSGQSRYLGVYNNQDWRCYTSINNNIKDCKTVFYKYSGVTKKNATVTIGTTDLKIGEETTVSTDGPALTLESSAASIASVNGTKVKGMAAGTATITATWSDDANYFGGTKTFTVTVIDPNAPGSTKENPYSVAQALTAIDALADGGYSETEVFVKGVISKIQSLDVSKYTRAQYFISDDGTETNQLYIYNGFYLDGADFTDNNQIAVGDEVIVKGKLQKYVKNSVVTPEVAQNNCIVYIDHKGKPSAGLAYATATVEKKLGDANFTNELTNPNNVSVTYDSSDKNVATVSTTGEVTIKGAGTTTITATFAGNNSFTGGSASYTLTVTDPSAPGASADNPFTVAQAIAAIDGGSTANAYVKGIISKIDEVNTTHGNATYWISDDGTTAQFEIYRGKYLEGADFTSADQISVGDEVVVFGQLKKYNETYEMNQGNNIVTLKHTGKQNAGLAYATATVEKNVGDANFTNELTNPNNLSVTYDSSDKNVAEVSATGEVTIKGAGETTITATFAGNDNYNAGSASYTLKVGNDVTVNVIDLRGKTTTLTFDPLNQFIQGSGYNSYETASLKGNDEVTYAGWSAENVMTGEKTGLQMRKADGKLTSPQILSDKGVKIEITKNEGTQASVVTITAGEKTSDTGSLSTSSTETNFTLTTGDKYAVVMKITITPLTGEVKLEPDLSYSVTHFEATVGDDFTKPELTNPYNLPITYTSSDDNVATVDDNGNIDIVGAGTVTITATFAGNSQYEGGSASYTIEVKAPVEDNGIVYSLVTDASTLAAGDVIVFVGENEQNDGDATITTYYAMCNKEKTSNFDATEVIGNGTTIKGNDNVQEINLEGEAGAWLFKVGEKYLYAASSSSNQLKTKTDIDENGNSNATISITEEGAAISFTGTNTRNNVKFNYNNGSPIINCYGTNDMPLVKIYRKSGGELGDIDFSGRVDVTDAMLVVYYILYDKDPAVIKKGYEHYDINKDGSINVTDVMLIVQIILTQD